MRLDLKLECFQLNFVKKTYGLKDVILKLKEKDTFLKFSSVYKVLFNPKSMWVKDS